MTLMVIQRATDGEEELPEIELPEGAQALGQAASVAWYRLPDGSDMPAAARAPTPDELARARLELPAVRRLKGHARRRIESEIGDVHEILADQARQIEALTALVCRLAASSLGGTAMSEQTQATYLARAEHVVDALDSGALTLRGDLEGADDMLMRLLDRANRINEIVGAEYLPRRDALLTP